MSDRFSFMTKQERKELFIVNARKKWGDKYDYSKVEYTNYHTKVCIFCPIHGEFWASPFEHLGGKGCRKCAKNGKLTTEEFIEKARKIHGDKYDYSKTEYKNATTKVCIICHEHGEFWQLPMSHIQGSNCPICGKITAIHSQQVDTEGFIERARKVHGDKYDYSKVKYIDLEHKVCIICPEHGEFMQSPAHHLYRSQGCPLCNRSILEENIANLLSAQDETFTQEKTFDWLKYEHHLRLDFYLPEYSIAIECQGRQHFAPIGFFGGQQALNETQERDHKKIELCKEHGITLLHYATCEIPEDFNLYQVITNEEELISTIKTLIENHDNNQRNN